MREKDYITRDPMRHDNNNFILKNEMYGMS